MADLSAPAFYFDPAVTRIDWESTETPALVNPEWLRKDAAAVERASRALPAFPAHVWLATSGTTSTLPGHIRWVALAKTAFLASAAAVNAHLESGADDVWAHALPIFHAGGLGILARAALSGASVQPAVAGRWDARRFHGRLIDTRATLTALVPSQLHDLVAAALRPPDRLRAVIVGGARLDPQLCADARRLGWRCLPSYGLTETCSQVATAALDSGVSEVCTGPLPVLRHAEIRSAEDQRIHIRASSLLTCYADTGADQIRAWDPTVDGWLETEDLGVVTRAGVEVLGRAAESVKVLGETVSVLRVEEMARRWVQSLGPPLHGLDVAIVALPHPRLGHELVLVLAAPISSGEPSNAAPRSDAASHSHRVEANFNQGPDSLLPSLLDFCRPALAPYELPQRVVQVARIPRTALGKCQRQLLAREVSFQPGAQA